MWGGDEDANNNYLPINYVKLCKNESFSRFGNARPMNLLSMCGYGLLLLNY